MAVTDFDRVTSITREKILPGIVDNIVKDNPILFRLLQKSQRLEGGNTIDQVIRYVNSTQGGWFSDLDVLDTGSEDTRTRARWNWRQVHQPIVFSNMDLAKNGGGSDTKIFDLLKTETEDAKLALQDKLGTAMWTAQSGDQMDSLLDAVDDGTNVATYGGINRSSYSWWQASYTASAGALSLSMMATSYDAAKSGSKVPTIIVTHESEWSSFEALLQPQVRFQFATAGYPKIDGGFQSMMFRNTPFIADEYATDGYMLMLNEDFLKFVNLKHPQHPTDKMGFTYVPMKTGIDQDGQIGYILNYLDLICVQPRRQAQIRGIT